MTSGYIISAGFTDDEPLRHFDVIIYDKLESPVLWRDGNPDTSEGGLSRPMPVEHVLCVLEVKATLTATTASKAIDKLRELRPLMKEVDPPDARYLIYLPADFVCGVVFFRVSLNEDASVLTPLVANDLRGYFGGIVLSAIEEPMCDEAGILQMQAGAEPIAGAPLKISDGHTWTPGVQYGNSHVSMMLDWDTNSFAIFAHKLIALLRGTFKINLIASFHGMSFPNASAWKSSPEMKVRRESGLEP